MLLISSFDNRLDWLIKSNIPDEISEVSTYTRDMNISENMFGQTEHVAAYIDIDGMTIGYGETGTDNLDIESILAAIHNDLP